MKRRGVLVGVCVVLVAVAGLALTIVVKRFKGGDGPQAPDFATAVPAVPPAQPSSTEAAVLYGWQRTGGDEFDGDKVDTARWDIYEGVNGVNESWSGQQCSVRNGTLTITGQPDALGTSCGIAWRQNQTYGRWEVRARMPAPADPGFAPVFLLWGADDANYPGAGEIDFAEEYDPDRQFIESWLHGPGNLKGPYFKSRPVDLTQWHNFAVDWQPDHVTIYLDGVPWGIYSDPKFIPRTPMHLTLQQNFTRKHPGPPLRSSVEIDWARIYRK